MCDQSRSQGLEHRLRSGIYCGRGTGRLPPAKCCRTRQESGSYRELPIQPGLSRKSRRGAPIGSAEWKEGLVALVEGHGSDLNCVALERSLHGDSDMVGLVRSFEKRQRGLVAGVVEL
jgi:hypothetical protein